MIEINIRIKYNTVLFIKLLTTSLMVFILILDF